MPMRCMVSCNGKTRSYRPLACSFYNHHRRDRVSPRRPHLKAHLVGLSDPSRLLIINALILVMNRLGRESLYRLCMHWSRMAASTLHYKQPTPWRNYRQQPDSLPSVAPRSAPHESVASMKSATQSSRHTMCARSRRSTSQQATWVGVHHETRLSLILPRIYREGHPPHDVQVSTYQSRPLSEGHRHSLSTGWSLRPGRTP